jgi:hypothetical protein
MPFHDGQSSRLYRRLGWSLLCEGVFDDSDRWGLDQRDGR